jgi:hypothetical protein
MDSVQVEARNQIAELKLTGIHEDLRSVIDVLTDWYEVSERPVLSSREKGALTDVWYATMANLETLLARVNALLPGAAVEVA